MNRYSVFAGRLQAIPPDIEFSFFGERGKYMLIYAEEAPNDSFTMIPSDKEKNLAADEREWLFHCKATLNFRWAKENEAEQIGFFNRFIDRFEEELQNARKELNENERREKRTE